MAVIITDPDNIIEADDVTTNTTTRRITINPGTGTNIPAAADGIAEQALYSWYKEEWKDVVNRSRYPFLFDAITPEQMEMRKGWEHSSTTSEKAVRTGGWRYIDTDNGNKIVKEFVGAISLGTFEDTAADTAYYVLGDDPTDTGAAIDFDFPGPVNEPILVYQNFGNPPTCTFTTSTITRATGSFVTDGYAVGGQVTILSSTSNDGTFTITAVVALTLTVSGTPFAAGADVNAELAVNNRNALALFLRVRDGDTNGKTFAKSKLSEIGVTEVDNKVFRFPLTNVTDLNILATDAAIAGTPWSQISLQYFASPGFSIDIDGATNRVFGIVANVGTFAAVDGTAPGGASVLTSALGEIPVSTAYDGGTLFLTSGPNENTSFPIVSTTATTVTVTGTIPVQTANSFYLQRAVPIVATKQQIYEKIQFQLRQASDINVAGGGGVVTGKTADGLAVFEGPDLKLGKALPNNPEGGGSGVTVLGFDANDTNNLFFYDNAGVQYNYPFVAAGNILVNANAVADTGPAEYVMYFEYTERFTNALFEMGTPAGQVATLTSTTTNLVTELTIGDFIKLSGWANPANDGQYEVTGAPAGAGPYTAEVTKRFNLEAIVAEATGATVSLDKNPIDTDDAIVVNDNSGTPITGIISGQTIPFDFDYDNNVQGGRTAATTANIVVRVLGTDVAVNAEASSSITRATGLSVSVTAPLERNYLNPI